MRHAKHIKEIKTPSRDHQGETDLPYFKEIFLNYEILVGKNSKKNEALTFGVARKNDMFLHAKDTPGSHVIIRSKTGQNIPMLVVEKAASYAAYYSKNKGETLVRVLYTLKKYVRKLKGGPVGTVIVSKEKVLLAEPEAIKK